LRSEPAGSNTAAHVAAADAMPLPLAGLALDRCSQQREDPLWLDAAWGRGRLLLISNDGRAPCLGDPLRLDAPACSQTDRRAAEASFLGCAGDTPWFALPTSAAGDDRRDGPTVWLDLRRAALQLPAFEAGLFAYAKALLLWQARTRFCGACGSPIEPIRAGHCRRCSNPACASEHYPRTDAAIIVLVTDRDGRALFGRQAGWPARRYSTLAGFVEPGESLEDCLRREVLEESGIRVGRCHYRSSQPWPFPASLMLGFRAEALSTEIQLVDELEDALWIGPDALLAAVDAGTMLLSPPISISFRLIVDWLLESQDPARVRALLPGA
jgi:NAD+ diphosphatase